LAYDMLKRRLRGMDITEHQPLTLVYLIDRFAREEACEILPRDPRLTEDLLSSIMGKTKPLGRAGAKILANAVPNGKTTMRKGD
jgi:hypothetical protein